MQQQDLDLNQNEFYRKISEIMDNFDFGKVKKIMEILNWGYDKYDGQVPEEKELRVFARELLEEAYLEETIINSGGFEAQYYPDHTLQLKFIIEDYDS